MGKVISSGKSSADRILGNGVNHWGLCWSGACGEELGSLETFGREEDPVGMAGY